MTMMRAAAYQSEGPAAEVLRVIEVERPEPSAGEVRVRIAVSAINPTDVKGRAGHTPRPIDGFQIPHMDGAGTIDAVGPGVPTSRIGERVWLMLAAHSNRWGTAAQWCVVPQAKAIPLPDDASFELGATLGVPSVTAADCLFGDGPITGRPVLIAGGAGGVGRAAIQLARWAGARVCATVSGGAKGRIAQDAGAERVINYRSVDALEQLRTWSPHVDRIVELALGANLDLDLGLSRHGTTIVTYAIDGDDPVLPIRRCMGAGVRLRFMLLYTLAPTALAAAVDTVSAALAAGALDLPPVMTFDLDDIVAAQQAQEAGPVGRVLVTLPA